MSLRLTAAQLQQLKADAQAAYPQEFCGVLVGQRTNLTVVNLHPVENAWTSDCFPEDLVGGGEADRHSRRDRYWIAPIDLLQIMQSSRSASLEIIGIYHSHPDHAALPSECDRQLAWPEYAYVILSVTETQVMDVRCWQLNADQQFQEIEIQVDDSA